MKHERPPEQMIQRIMRVAKLLTDARSAKRDKPAENARDAREKPQAVKSV